MAAVHRMQCQAASPPAGINVTSHRGSASVGNLRTQLFCVKTQKTLCNVTTSSHLVPCRFQKSRSNDPTGEVTQLLQRWSEGYPEVLDDPFRSSTINSTPSPAATRVASVTTTPSNPPPWSTNYLRLLNQRKNHLERSRPFLRLLPSDDAKHPQP
jgi:hypothetical protein